MTTAIQEGSYLAHLDRFEVKQSAGGNPVLCFQWRLDKSGVLVRSFAGLALKDGSPNEKGMALIRKWAPGWDGDPYWFGEHLDEARGYAVRLKIVNEPAWNDPARIVPTVKWVNPARWIPASDTAGASPAETPGLPPDVDLEPTMQDTWRLWCAMTRRNTASFRDKTWLWYVRETDPNKDQIDFTADDWFRMQQRMRAGGRGE